MKFLWYIPRLNIGGAESLSVTLLNELSNEHSVIIITDTKKSNQLFKINNKIKIIHLDDKSNLFYLLKLFKLRKIILKNRNSYFISNLTHANINSYLALLFTGVKIYAIEHNTLSKYLSHKINFKNIILNILCFFIYKNLYKIISVSNYVNTDLINNYNCKNSLTIHNAIDLNDIQIKSELFDCNIVRPYIIFVGRIEKQKNLSKLISIFYQLTLDGIPHNLVIIGNGFDLNLLKAQADNFNLSNRVIFLGEQSNPYPYIKNADLSIMTSLFEGFGIFLLESLALGVKVFTYDNKIISEITNNTYYIEKFTATNCDTDDIKKIKLLLASNINKNELIKLTSDYDSKIVSKKYIENIIN